MFVYVMGQVCHTRHKSQNSKLFDKRLLTNDLLHNSAHVALNMVLDSLGKGTARCTLSPLVQFPEILDRIVAFLVTRRTKLQVYLNICNIVSIVRNNDQPYIRITASEKNNHNQVKKEVVFSCSRLHQTQLYKTLSAYLKDLGTVLTPQATNFIVAWATQLRQDAPTEKKSRHMLRLWGNLIFQIAKLTPTFNKDNIRWHLRRGLLEWCFYVTPAILHMDLLSNLDNSVRTIIENIIVKLTHCAKKANINHTQHLWQQHQHGNLGNVALNWKLLVVGVMMFSIQYLAKDFYSHHQFVTTIAIMPPTPINQVHSTRKEKRQWCVYENATAWFEVWNAILNSITWRSRCVTRRLHQASQTFTDIANPHTRKSPRELWSIVMQQLVMKS